MAMTQNERQKKWGAKFARPAITIPKNKNDDYKKFVANKGYNSLNDYFNSIIVYDTITNIIPDKKDIEDIINTNTTTVADD